jgi:L-asparaginase II
MTVHITQTTDVVNSPGHNPVVLVEVTRGPIVESWHYGTIAVADPNGGLIAWAGDPNLMTYYRSSAKPIQAVPLVESGAADHFGLTDAEVAVVCGSHGGEDIHVEAVTSILSKIGAGPEMLACGVHAPYDRAAARLLEERGQQPTVLHNNCSGKHAGMLALARYHDWPLQGYQRPDHPVQQTMLRVVAEFAGLRPQDIAVGVDGCGVCTFGIPVRLMAVSFARLADPHFWPEPRRSAVGRIVRAMTAHPEMVAAHQGRLDTELMRVGGGALIAKAGAEAVYCAGRLAMPRQSAPAPAVGFALKLLDGDPAGRARNPAVMEGLRQAGLLDEDALARLEQYRADKVRNRPGDVVGEVRPAFTLQGSGPGAQGVED